MPPVQSHGAAPLRSPLIVSYDGADPDDQLLEWVSDGLVTGVVLFKENAPDEASLQSAVTKLRHVTVGELTFMIDEEGGRVRRLPDDKSSMPALRSYEGGSLERLRDDYDAVSERLVRLGIDTLLAPVVDVGGGTSEWLRERTYSDDPERVAAMASAVIPAIQSHNLRACAKHFPGSRAVAADPHHDRAVDSTPPSEWEKTDAVPFRAAIIAGVRAIMVGHQCIMGFDATRPACLSSLIITVLLRQRLGFGGLILSDDLAMDAITGQFDIEVAVRAAWEAGCNRILVCRNRSLQERAVATWQEMRHSHQGSEPA